MKICKYCKHFGRDEGTCEHPKNFESNPITGETERVGYEFASSQRKCSLLHALIYGNCGKIGRWFEPTVEK